MTDERPPDPLRWRQLLHTWLFEYNPLYLVSAAVTLAGAIALSEGLASHMSAAAQMGVTAIAELYGWALIGSAALLVRRGQRRAAVMLGLLAGVYLCDPTLHTATSPWFGSAGAVGSVLWLVSFVGKIRALAWALQLSPSRGAFSLLVAGAAGVTLVPWALRALEPELASVLARGWLFGLLAAALWSRRGIASDVSLDAWGRTVLRRSLRGAWAGFGAAIVAHASFWTSQYGAALDLPMFVPIALLLATRFVHRERSCWLLVAGTLGWVGLWLPGELALTSGLAAVVLLLRAFRLPGVEAPVEGALAHDDPYRRVLEAGDRALPRRVFAPAPAAERQRLCSGALASTYLAVWTLGFHGGPWPEHALVLDLLLLAAGVLAWRRGAPVALAPGATAFLHAAIVGRWIPTPHSLIGWGIAGVSAGFGLLAVSLAISLLLPMLRAWALAGPVPPEPAGVADDSCRPRDRDEARRFGSGV